MSTQYPGGFITKSPVAPTTSAASGIWTVDQALQYVKAGTWPSPPIFIEDVFSTYLYTGNSSTQTITNNIDLSTKGGLVWCKDRSTIDNHFLSDTAQGTGKDLASNGTFAATTQTGITAFNTTGFTLGNIANANTSTRSYVSWTLAKQPKFFDIVTYTGTGANRTISHNLGSTPGCIIVKRTDAAANWQVYHRSLANTQYMVLNSTAAVATGATRWNSTTPTSTVFSVGTDTTVNASAGTYVAYLFAHDAGGFLANGGGSTNGITCGSVTSSGGVLPSVNLGYEPQWLLMKGTGATGFGWTIQDNMRGSTANGGVQYLRANTDGAENSDTTQYGFSATGLNGAGTAGFGNELFIYIAIRRGPMKTPTVGTSVFLPTSTNAAAGTSLTIGFPADMSWGKAYNGIDGTRVEDRLRGYSNAYNATATGSGISPELNTTSTAAENSGVQPILYKAYNTTVLKGGVFDGMPTIFYNFGRAPGFFDVVCYTGNGTTLTVSHNLGTAPQMMAVKMRTSVGQDWAVYFATLGNNYALRFNQAFGIDVIGTFPYWNNTTPTASNFVVDNTGNPQVVNGSAKDYVAYLFATVAGVSKVGSYTGTAALQTVNCGFTTGARFVLIKRTDTTGDWYVYDSARGIGSSTDPYYLLNSTNVQVTGTDYVDTDTTGFKVTAAASTTVNVSAATYIFLAIA